MYRSSCKVVPYFLNLLVLLDFYAIHCVSIVPYAAGGKDGFTSSTHVCASKLRKVHNPNLAASSSLILCITIASVEH